MKKRCLAVFLAACVTVGSVLMPSEGMAVYAAEETAVLLQEEGEEASGTETTEGEAVESAGEDADAAETETTETEETQAGTTGQETETEEAETEETGSEEAGSGETELEETGSEETEPEKAELGEAGSGETESEEAETEENQTEEAELGETELKETDSEETELEETELEETELEEETELKEAELTFPTGGLLPIEVQETDRVEEDDIYTAEEDSQLKRSAVYNHDWDKYSSNYFYNQMSDNEKEFWDALDAMCLTYLTTNKNVAYMSEYQGYYSDFVTAKGMTKDMAVEVYYIFRYSNPQYYFLNTGCLMGSYLGTSVISAGIYANFANGASRAQATARVQSQADSWQGMINALGSDEQKVKLIHDLIIQKVDYNYAIYNDPNFDEETQYSQTAYSVFCTDLTVCAGYAQAFEMMCNSSGIDAVAVTSADHEWNKVRINDSWYNVDCTWDDAGNDYPVYYDFFAKNDAYYDSAQQAASHAEESYWNKYLPPCTLTSTSSGWTAGAFPAITQVTGAPQINAKTDSEGDCEITITAPAAGARIYYTLDGTSPEESATKSIRYNESFYVDKSVTVNAIAVCDGYRDSGVTSKSVAPSKKITITYNGNGATSGKMSKQTGYTNSTITLKKNAFKKTGYSFAGWNTKKNGKGSSYTNKQKVSSFTGNVTLYAQWETPTYKITYKLDGGKNNKSNPATYKKTTKTITLKKPTKTGYTFKGWYSDKKFKKKVTAIKKGSTGNKTLYAKWEANKYTIKFNGNGSTKGKMSSLTNCKYGKSYKLTANKFKKSGYTFVGWNTKKNGKGKSYKNKQSIKNLTSKNRGTVTLYAQWKKK